jgi:hypothetical protein
LLPRPVVHPDTLHPEQRVAFDLVMQYRSQPLSAAARKPFCAIVQGGAGTGKSYIVNALAGALGPQVLLTATTGCAAAIVCVYTTLKGT